MVPGGGGRVNEPCWRRAALGLLVLVCLVGCGDADTPPTPGWGVWSLSPIPLLLLQRPDGSVEALRPGDHARQWVVLSPQGSDGQVRCPPILGANQVLHLTFRDRVLSVDALTGEARFEHPAATGRVCAAVAPDSGLLIPEGTANRATAVFKVNAEGERVWRFEPPSEEGGLTHDLRVNPTTGDAYVRTARTLRVLSPAGEVHGEFRVSSLGR